MFPLLFYREDEEKESNEEQVPKNWKKMFFKLFQKFIAIRHSTKNRVTRHMKFDTVTNLNSVVPLKKFGAHPSLQDF